eukprot:CAMPEP_0173182236 /NCGR_PEP_ID=MMETSP1141-20130122/7722_1 /TAXON_ID=483371 /ORGANISM="non described non described, Strain CCMP2298" /LENGTH=106 /DNA_ID=CAMNT_0014105301 /DNA_START=407 /DNA_END=728 /DNA_ORIENTATION=-
MTGALRVRMHAFDGLSLGYQPLAQLSHGHRKLPIAHEFGHFFGLALETSLHKGAEILLGPEEQLPQQLVLLLRTQEQPTGSVEVEQLAQQHAQIEEADEHVSLGGE